MDLCESMDLLAKLLFTILTLATVIGGWAVVNALQSRREVSKSLIAKLEGMREKLAQLEALGKEFHSGQSHCAHKANRIVRAIKLLSTELKDAEQSGAIKAGWAELQFRLRSSMTLQNFDPATFQTQLYTSSVIMDFEYAKDSLDGYLMGSIRQLNEKLCQPESVWTMLKSIKPW